MDVISYALSKKIAAHVVSGVQSMSVNGQTLTINTKDSGVLTMTFPTPKDGVSVTDIDVNTNNQIVFTMSDGSEFISGKIPTVKGESGFSPTITENADNTDKIYKLDIATADSIFTTPNLKGADGQGGGGGDSSVTLTQEEYEALTEEQKLNGLYYIYDTKRIYKNGIRYGASEPIPLTMAEYEALKEAGAIDEQQEYLIEADDKGILISAEDIGYSNTKSGIQATTVQDAIDKIAENGGSGEKNVQSDWNETDDTADGFIKNKPTIPEAYDDTALSNRVKTIEDDYAKSSDIPSLSGYATETWVNEQGFLTQHQDLSNYATKDEIPTVPSKVSELTNDNNYQTAEQVNSTVTTEITKVVADAPEEFDTLKEMSDWIAGHKDSAAAMNSAISDNKTAITVLQTGKADKSEIPTSLPADGGNADTVNNHTVETDVPESAVFTDTVYDDTEVKESIDDLNSNLVGLEYGEVAGGKNLFDCKFINKVIDMGGNYTQRNLKEEFGLINNVNGIIYTTFGGYFKKGTYTFSYTNDAWFSLNRIAIAGTICYGTSEQVRKSYTWTQNVDGFTYFGIEGDDSETGIADTPFSTTPDIMIEKGSTATTPYEPYIPSVKMLAEEVDNVNESLGTIGKCKNLLNPTLQTTTQNGVTCTANGDGTYTLNGTASGLTTFILCDMKLDSNLSYKLTGCPLGGDWDNGYSMYVEKQYWGIDVGKGYEITLTDASNVCGVYIRIIKGTVCNNLVFKPMITTDLSATYDDYVPYTGDGDTLAADVAEIKNDLGASNAGAHNSVYRGKYLGNALTTEQKAQISVGTFNDLYIGDYWTIGGVNYRIAAFDYWLNSGDTTCTTHHIVIVPDTCLYNAKMNTTNVTTGAYIGSEMYKTNLAQAKTTINNAFGSANILSHREYLANATKSTTDPTYESAGSWYDSTVELMNERMVYGADVFHNIEINGAIPANYTIDKSQLPLFVLEPSRICNRADWWLRDVVSAASFAFVGYNGNAATYHASYSLGVRPAFAIKG